MRTPLRVSLRKRVAIPLLLALAAVSSAAWLLRSRPDADVLLDAALAALEDGDDATAAGLLESILSRDPEHGLALLYRGQLARDRNNLDGALADWRRVPDDPAQEGAVARHLKGTLLLETRQGRAAERALRRASELNPGYLPPRERLLELYVVQMRREDILRELEEISRLRPWTLEELVLRATAGERFRPVPEGLEVTRAFADADPDDLESGLALARYRMEVDDHEEALRGLKRLQRNGPRDQRILALLIEAHLQQGDIESARTLAADGGGMNVTSPWLWRSLGRLAMQQEDWNRAVRCFSAVVTALPDDLPTRYHLGTALHRVGRHDEAARHLADAELLDRLQRQAFRIPRGDRSRTDLLQPILVDVAQVLLRLERPLEAVHWFERASAIDPSDPATLAGLRRSRQRLAQTARSGAKTSPPGDTISGGAPAAWNDFGPAVGRSEDASPGGSNPDAIIRLCDTHEEAGLQFQYFNGQEGLKYLVESMGGAVGVVDFDGDGWPDLFFPQGCRLPWDPEDRTHTDRLFRNRGDGGFEDVTEAAGVDDNRYGQGCAVGDFDNDGFPDLFVANFGRNTLYRNNGDGTFTDVSEESGLAGDVWSSSAAFADLDRDGNLDLYVVNYVDSLKVCRSPDGQISTCDPQNFGAEQDVVYRNLGDGRFQDVTSESGIVAPDGKGLGVIIADLDDDGWPNVYVANDGTPNFFFRNLAAEQAAPPEIGQFSEAGPSFGGGFRFEERGLVSGTALSGDGRSEAGMGVACADLDGDGRLDLYVTNFYLETNTLYLNQGGGLFVDMTRSAGLAEPTTPLLGFGTQAIDLDLDGRPELFVANGHIDDFEFRGEPWKMPPQLFQNRGGGRFRDVSRDGGPYFHGKYLGRGVARIDWNRDGRPDLVVAHQDRPVALLTNETENAGRPVVLELYGTRSNRDAVGSRIRVSAGGTVQVLEVCGGDGFFSSNERRQVVGTGAAEQLDWLEVQWPNGKLERWSDLPSGVRLVVIEGRPPLVRAIRESG